MLNVQIMKEHVYIRQCNLKAYILANTLPWALSIFPSNLFAPTLAKAINGLKNPRWQPYGPDPKTHIFFTGFHGLITGFLRVKYGFSSFPNFENTGFVRDKYGISTGKSRGPHVFSIPGLENFSKINCRSIWQKWYIRTYGICPGFTYDFLLDFIYMIGIYIYIYISLR